MLATALLGGCGPKADEFAPQCPDLKLLSDAADLTRFRPGGRDMTDMVVGARITAVPASCRNGDKGTVAATLQVSMSVARGPAMTGRSAQVPFFISVLDGDRIVAERDYVATATFPSNVDRVDITSDSIDLSFPVSATKAATAYTIYVAFRLTPEELAYNRRGVTR
jgi:hypothetical protein